MENIRVLLDQGELDEAADALYDGLYYLINTLPNVDLTKAEFDQLIPVLFEKMKNPTQVKGRPSAAPGDDIITKPAKGHVSVIFTGPPNMPLPYDIETVVPRGSGYSFEVPKIPGYVSDLKRVEGGVGNGDVVTVVTYTKEPAQILPPKYGTIRIKKDYTGTAKGYTAGTAKPGEVLHAYIAGKYVKNKFDVKDETPEHLKPAHDEKIKDKGYYWPGIVIHAPEDMKNPLDYKKIKARMRLPESNEWLNFTLGDTSNVITSAEPSAYTDKFIAEPESYLWVPVTPEMLDNPNGADGFYHFLVQIDWNNDGVYEQDLDIAVQPDATYLYASENGFTNNVYEWPLG